MASSWFDQSYYLSAKAAYNNAHATGGLTTWTATSVQAAFNAAGITPEQHYTQYGWIEGLSPDAYYVESQYVTSKVAALNAGAFQGKTTWTSADFYSSLNGSNPFMHYVQYGAYETGVEPSTGFDDDTYYTDKAAYNNAHNVNGITTWTAATVMAAFQAAGLTPIGHYELYGQTEAFYTPTPTPVPGQTYTLTTGVDTATANTFNGVMSDTAAVADTGTLNSADSLTGAAGTDVLNARVTSLGAALTVAPTLTGVESVIMSSIDTSSNMAAINLATATGTTTVGFKDITVGAVSALVNASTTAGILLDNADAVSQNVNLGSATGRTGTADAFSVTIANASGSSTANAGLQLVTNTAGFVTADTSFETANVTVAGAGSFVQGGTSLAGLTTLNVTGAATGVTTGYGLTLSEAANFNSLKTIDASKMTGGGLSLSVTGAPDVSFTGSAQNDRLIITGGTTNLTASDSLNFGTGTADILGFGTDTAVASYSAAKLALINAVTTADKLQFTAAAMTTLKANDFTAVNDFVFSGGNTTTATTLAITGVETADTFTTAGTYAAAAAAAQTAATAGTAGSDALSFAGAAVAQTANLKLDGGRSITGMTGQANTNAGAIAGGAGGKAISFGSNITTLTINSTGDTANSITGGTGGASTNGTGGAAAVAIDNTTAVQSVTITGSQALTIAPGTGGAGGVAAGAVAGGFSGAVNVNASTFTGKLTLTGSTGADIITTGTGANVIRGFGGQDTVTFNTGFDQLDLRTVTDSNTLATCETIGSFTAGTDKVVTSAAVANVKQGALYTATGTGVLATDIATAITAGGAIGNLGSAVVTITGTGAGTYWVFDANNSGAYVDGGTDVCLKLSSLSGTLSTGDFATSIA